MVNAEFYSIGHKIYLVLKKKTFNNNDYVFLANEMDSTDIMIRKIINGVLEPLTNEEELVKIIPLFVN